MTKPIILLDDAGFVFRTPTPDDYRFVIHGNGKGRKRKVMIKTPHGIYSARRYMYKVYHPDWDLKGKVIHLNQDDLDFSESNLVLLTERECNNLVHFNNNLTPKNNPQLQSQAIDFVRARIAVHDLDKEGGVYHERSTKS